MWGSAQREHSDKTPGKRYQGWGLGRKVGIISEKCLSGGNW